MFQYSKIFEKNSKNLELCEREQNKSLQPRSRSTTDWADRFLQNQILLTEMTVTIIWPVLTFYYNTIQHILTFSYSYKVILDLNTALIKA